MHGKLSELAVEEIIAQRARDGSKRQLVPGDRRFVEEPHLEALRSRSEAEIEQTRAEHDVDLVDLRQADDRVQRSDLDLGARLLHGLARGAGQDRLAVLQEPRRERPQSVSRLDRSLAQQDLTVPLRQTADDDLGILIMHRTAVRAHVARQRVAVRDAVLERRGAAVAAEIHLARSMISGRLRDPEAFPKDFALCLSVLDLDEVLTVVLELIDRLVDVGKRLMPALLDPTPGELRLPAAAQLLQRRYVEMSIVKVVLQRRHPAGEETPILADRIPAHRRDPRR